MSYINPIHKKSSCSNEVQKSPDTKGRKLSEKVARVAEFPRIEGKRGIGAQVTVLEDAWQLHQKIRKEWNFLSPEDLAEKIVDLEDKVEKMNPSDPRVQKIAKAVEHLHFQFVFPVVLELEANRRAKDIPFSFARTIQDKAQEIFRSHSFDAFQDLTAMQKKEIIRYAGGEA